MEIATTIKETREIIKEWRRQGLSIGLVPTMGFLHEGHESLIRKSVQDNDRTIVSIFVNPMQFGKNEDLETYPRDLERDSRLCLEDGVDLIFNPTPEEMYPDQFFSFVDMTTITGGLCGSDRPDHFRGVCTVVSKLFHITAPDRAYFGQKDAQQLSVIKKMVRDLNFDLEVIGCPTIREADGLAKSSRNTYLSQEERRAATVINCTLRYAEDALAGGERNAVALREDLIRMLRLEPLAQIEYVEIVDWKILQPIKKLEKPALIAVAVKFGKTRLIDNFIWE